MVLIKVSSAKIFFLGLWRSCRIVSRIFYLTFRTPPFLPQANYPRAFFPNTNFSFHSMPPEYTKLSLLLRHCPEMPTRSSHLMRFYSAPEAGLKPRLSRKRHNHPAYSAPSFLRIHSVSYCQGNLLRHLTT